MTGGLGDFAVSDDQRPIMERRPVFEDAADELTGYTALNRDTVGKIFVNGFRALEYDNGAGM